MRNKVVVRYLDGRVLKGETLDFVPNREWFHLASATDAKMVVKIFVKELKAVFFVKSLEGDPNYRAPAGISEVVQAPGRRLRVTFRDGEAIFGTAAVYTPGRGGFFLVPADPRDNNERIYVFVHAARSVETVQGGTAAIAAAR